MGKVIGVGGIFFYAKDSDFLQSWYKNNLGIDMQDWGGTAFSWEDEKGQPIKGTTVFSIADSTSGQFEPGSAKFMINFRVSELSSLMDSLRSSGCQVLDETNDSEYGKFGWVIDPEGNKIELWEPPSGQ